MFDFFKDLYFEANNFDMDMIREEKKKKLEKEKSETIYLKKNTKKIVIIFDILFCIVTLLSCYISIKTNNVFGIIKSIFLVILSVVIIIFLPQKKKKSEMTAIVCLILLIILTFFVGEFDI